MFHFNLITKYLANTIQSNNIYKEEKKKAKVLTTIFDKRNYGCTQYFLNEAT